MKYSIILPRVIFILIHLLIPLNCSNSWGSFLVTGDYVLVGTKMWNHFHNCTYVLEDATQYLRLLGSLKIYTI